MRTQRTSSGSSTWTTWKRRVSAGSFSMCFLYSAQVVAAIVRSVPRARAGFSRLAASPVPAAPPAPISVCASSMNRMIGFGERLHLVDHLAQPLLELALHAGAGLQQADVEREQAHARQHRRHVALHDAMGEALDHRRLADAGLADEDRVVLAAAHQDVDHLADLLVAADDRIDLPAPRLLGQIDREAAQRLLLAHLRRRHLAGGGRAAVGERLGGLLLGRALGDLGEALAQLVGADLAQLARKRAQRHAQVVVLQHADQQMAAAHPAGLVHQGGVEPALLDRAPDMDREIRRARAARQLVERPGQVAVELRRVELEMLHRAVQVGIHLLQDLMQPVRQLDIGIAAPLAVLGCALDRLVGDLGELAEQGCRTDFGHGDVLP